MVQRVMVDMKTLKIRKGAESAADVLRRPRVVDIRGGEREPLEGGLPACNLSDESIGVHTVEVLEVHVDELVTAGENHAERSAQVGLGDGVLPWVVLQQVTELQGSDRVPSPFA